MEFEAEEWLSVKDAAILHGCRTQNIHYHFTTSKQLKDYKADAKAAGRDPSLRVKKSELLALASHRTKSNKSSHNSRVNSSERDGVEDRLNRIESMLEILLGTRMDAAQILKVRVEQQADDIEAERHRTRQAEAERDALFARLQEFGSETQELRKELSNKSATLLTYAEALTQLISPSIPPDLE